LTVANPESAFDYVALLAGEIPDRALWPIGLRWTVDGAATIPAAAAPDASYLLTVAKTNALDILTGVEEPLVVELATVFAGRLGDIASVSLDNNANFVTEFDADRTAYANGTMSWALGSDTALAPDLFVVVVKPASGETGIAMMPYTSAATFSFDASTIFGFTPSTSDLVFLGAVKFPTNGSSEPNANAYDPTTILGYDLPAINIWTNYDISGLLGG